MYKQKKKMKLLMSSYKANTSSCPGIKLTRSLTSISSQSSTPESDAINWAIEKKVNILSLSFGTKTDSEVLHNAIKRAQENNILIVAAGNDSQIEYPAAYPEVIAVGSIGTDTKSTCIFFQSSIFL